MKAGSRQQPGEASARRHPLTGIVPVSEITAPPASHNARFGTAPGSRLGHQVADHIGG